MSAEAAVLALLELAAKIAPSLVAKFAGKAEEDLPAHLAAMRASIKAPIDVAPADTAFDEAFEKALDGDD